jgi:uncharacterized protein (TIGR00255 family)
MIFSMTGFGRQELDVNDKKIIIEIQSLNSKSLDVNFRVNDSFYFITEYVRKSIKDRLIKGKIDVTIDIVDLNEDYQIPFNKKRIKSYVEELKKDFKIDETQIISNLLSDNKFISPKISYSKAEKQKIKNLLDNVIHELIEYRRIEGVTITKDLKKSISTIETNLKKVVTLESTRIKDKKNKFKSYFNEIEGDYDKSRLEQEIIYYIEKIDINEELIRLKHHLNFFTSEMKKKDIRGKKLSFISQEIGREINTIGSKANNFKIQSMVVNMKEEVEKIKENIFNIL